MNAKITRLPIKAPLDEEKNGHLLMVHDYYSSSFLSTSFAIEGWLEVMDNKHKVDPSRTVEVIV